MKQALLFCLLFLVSCSPTPEKKAPPNTLRMATKDDAETFDPRKARSLAAQTICKMLYDGLMRIDEEGRPIPSLAQIISISPDKRTYTVTLQESLWSNGEPVTAYDFESAWKHALDPTSGSENSAMLYPLKNGRGAHQGEGEISDVGVKAIHNQMLVIQLEEPTPYFLELLAHPVYSPMCSDPNAVNGPFVIASHRLCDQIVLKKNERYWDAAAVSLDGITLVVVPDATTAVHLFDKGELDWIGSPAGHLPQDYAENAPLCTAPVAATLWYKFNTTRPPLNNAKLRQALSLAVDRKAITEYVLKNGTRPTSSPLPSVLQKGAQSVAQNLPRAQALLQEALDEMGLSREKLPSITLVHSNNEMVSRLTQALQQQWKEALGLSIELEGTEFTTLVARMGRMDYQMGGAKIWFADYQDPTNFLSLFAEAEQAGQGGLNETGWESPEYARLLERASVEIDGARREKLLAKAEALFVEEMPVLPICDYNYLYQKRHFAGERLPPAGTPDFKWVRRTGSQGSPR